jgi:hypothetical protein
MWPGALLQLQDLQEVTLDEPVRLPKRNDTPTKNHLEKSS